MTGLVKPSERFRQEIEPALADYRAGSLPSERLANNLAKAIDHHLEWTFSYYEARTVEKGSRAAISREPCGRRISWS